MKMRVISQSTANRICDILLHTIEDGTATSAKIAGLAIGGKTGTSQKYDKERHEYSKSKYISSFVAFAPYPNAKICILVVIDEPKDEYYGGKVAAPVVKEILEKGHQYIDF